MRVYLSTLVVASVYISMSSTTEVFDFDVVKSIRAYIPTPVEQSTEASDQGSRRRRSISSTEESTILNKINSLRRSVGSSDMNYLTYSSSVASDCAKWASNCDFDANFYSNAAGFAIVKPSKESPDHVAILEEGFNDPQFDFYSGLRSVYLRSIGAGSTFCYQARVEGKYYYSVYLTAYGFSNTSYFNENRIQFTLGEKCTACQSHSYWCYEGLCRDDCTSQMSYCSCFSGCTKCQDWNRGSCTCPSQPLTDASKLNCSMDYRPNGEAAFKAEALWAMIAVSMIVLFYLQ